MKVPHLPNPDHGSPDDHSLVGANTLLETLFPNPADRPSLRWLREMQAKRLIPFKKIGAKIVRFDVAEVRAALDRNFHVEAE